jgi:hypothetical protein
MDGNEWWFGKDWEESDRGLNEVLPQNLLGGTEEIHKKSLVRIADSPDKIRTEDPPNTNQDFGRYANGGVLYRSLLHVCRQYVVSSVFKFVCIAGVSNEIHSET